MWIGRISLKDRPTIRLGDSIIQLIQLPGDKVKIMVQAQPDIRIEVTSQPDSKAVEP